jgi:hypothetical protein
MTPAAEATDLGHRVSAFRSVASDMTAGDEGVRNRPTRGDAARVVVPS